MGKTYSTIGGVAKNNTAIYGVVNGVAKAVKKVYAVVGGVAKLVWEAVSDIFEETVIDYIRTDSVLWLARYYDADNTYYSKRYISDANTADLIHETPYYQTLDTAGDDISDYSENGLVAADISGGTIYYTPWVDYTYSSQGFYYPRDDITNYTSLSSVQSNKSYWHCDNIAQTGNGDKLFVPVKTTTHETSPYAFQLSILIYNWTGSGYEYSGVIDKAVYLTGYSSSYYPCANYTGQVKLAVSDNGKVLIIYGFAPTYGDYAEKYRFQKIYVQQSDGSYSLIHSQQDPDKNSSSSSFSTNVWISPDFKYIILGNWSNTYTSLYSFNGKSLTFIAQFGRVFNVSNIYYYSESQQLDIVIDRYIYTYQLSESGITELGYFNYSGYTLLFYDINKTGDYMLTATEWDYDTYQLVEHNQISRKTTGVISGTSRIRYLNDWRDWGSEEELYFDYTMEARYLGM